MELVDIYSDDGISSFDEFRLAFYTMIEDAKCKALDCKVVRDFSRFNRNYIEAGKDVTYILQNIDNQRELIESEINSIETEIKDYKENNSPHARWLKPFIQYEGVILSIEELVKEFVNKIEIMRVVLIIIGN